MRKAEKEAARLLRKEGMPYGEICRILGVARSSVSNWVSDIEITQEQKLKLAGNRHSYDAIESRKRSRKVNENKRRSVFLLEGLHDIEKLPHVDLFTLGLGIYWGEGAKTTRGTIGLTNTDPRLIQLHVLFLRKVMKFPLSKIRVHVCVHEHISKTHSEKYWAKITGIPDGQFTKTSVQSSKAGKGERDKLPYGTCTIDVYDTQARIRLEGWIQGVYRRLFPDNTDLHNETKLRI